MKRRTFIKTTAAATAAPAIWSEAKAQARNETLLIVTEAPPFEITIDCVPVGAFAGTVTLSW